MKEFKIESPKISKRDIGCVKAYAVNTHNGIFSEVNCDRISIVTNLYADSKQPLHFKISFFAIYDGHNGSSCAEFLRDNVHSVLAKD